MLSFAWWGRVVRANRFKKVLIKLDDDAIRPAEPQIRYVPIEPDDRISPPVIDDTLAWYALVVRPGTHRRVMAAMRRAKIVAYCPVETRWSRRARSNVREEVQRPLFGSILFVGTDEATSWAAIRFNDDITGILSNNGSPEPIPADDLRALADREIAGDFTKGRDEAAIEPEPEAIAVSSAGIAVGDVAALGEGIFVGAEVDVVGLQDNEAKVVLRHFRSASIMRVPVAMLQPVAKVEAEAMA